MTTSNSQGQDSKSNLSNSRDFAISYEMPLEDRNVILILLFFDIASLKDIDLEGFTFQYFQNRMLDKLDSKHISH